MEMEELLMSSDSDGLLHKGGSSKSINYEMDKITRRRSTKNSLEYDVEGGSRASRSSSVSSFTIFKKSITFDSQYKEYKEEVKVKEPHFTVKRVVSTQGEKMLTAIKTVSRKIEVLAIIPEILSRLILGDFELERVLGSEIVDAILRLLFIQVHWIEYRNIGEAPFRFLGASIQEIKRRLQKGARPSIRKRKKKSLRLMIRESIAELRGYEEEGEDEDTEYEESEFEDEYPPGNRFSSTMPPPTPSSYHSLSPDISPTGSVTGPIGSDTDSCIGPQTLGLHNEEYMADQLKAAYREVFRLITSNELNMDYLSDNIKPEVTHAVKVFYGQIQLLEGLMYVKLLMTPEEEIQRLEYLKQLWIKEQRLLRDLRTLEDEFEEFGTSRERAMRILNANINKLISEIDAVNDSSRYEVNKISAEGNKQHLVNTKSFDQDLQQLDGNFQAALKFAMKLRTKYSEIELEWKKLQNKHEQDLRDVISEYDLEMTSHQQILDDLEVTEAMNKAEINRLEDEYRDVELRYARMLDETMIKRLNNNAKMRKKKKGKKGKGKKGRGGKSKGKKSKAKPKTPKRSKGKPKKKKKEEEKSSDSTDMEESEVDTQEESGEEEMEKGSKKKKRKKKSEEDKEDEEGVKEKSKTQTKSSKGKKIEKKKGKAEPKGEGKKKGKKSKKKSTQEDDFEGEEEEHSESLLDLDLDLIDDDDGEIRQLTESSTAEEGEGTVENETKKEKKGKGAKKEKRSKSELSKKKKKKKKSLKAG